MQPPFDGNPLIFLWQISLGLQVFEHFLFQCINIIEIVVVMVLGSVENEHTFNNLAFTKSKLRNE